MLQVKRKPTNARSKRMMEKKEPKIIEDIKTAIVVKGENCSNKVLSVMKDLALFKKPDVVILQKDNKVKPFEDVTSLEFLADKNNASLFMVGNHIKKRPHTITIGRTFNKTVLDFVELSVSEFISVQEFQQFLGSKGAAVGQKPAMIFSGDWSKNDLLKNIFIDMFHGQVLDKVALSGLSSVLSFSVDPVDSSKIYLRVYGVDLKKSSTKTPFVQLQEVGPFVDFKVCRVREHDEAAWHQATRVAAVVTGKKKANIETDEFGATVGTIHLGKQDLSRLQTRKMKGLKRSRSVSGQSDQSDNSDKSDLEEQSVDEEEQSEEEVEK